MRKRITAPGPVIRNMRELERALQEPCIYMGGGPKASAFVVGIPYRTLHSMVYRGLIRKAKYTGAKRSEER